MKVLKSRIVVTNLSCRRTCVQLEESARLMARCGNSLGSRPLRIPGVWVAIDIDLHEQAFARYGDDGWQETGGRLSSMWDAPRSTVESAWISDETNDGCLSATTQSRDHRWWVSSDHLPRKRVRGSQGPDLNRRWAALQALIPFGLWDYTHPAAGRTDRRSWHAGCGRSRQVLGYTSRPCWGSGSSLAAGVYRVRRILR